MPPDVGMMHWVATRLRLGRHVQRFSSTYVGSRIPPVRFSNDSAVLTLRVAPVTMHGREVAEMGHIQISIARSEAAQGPKSSPMTFMAYPRNVGLILHALRRNKLVTISHQVVRSEMDHCTLQIDEPQQSSGVGTITLVQGWDMLEFRSTPAERLAMVLLLEYA
eukprot:EG_transcript_38691